MPESIFTASFQLSFAATLAIVALYESYGHVLVHMHVGLARRLLLYFFGLMVTSLAATFYTSPLAIIHFNRMAMYGILANMVIVPLSSFWIMPMALMAFLTMPFGWDAPFLHWLKMGLKWMMEMSRFVEHFPYANITLPAPNAAGIVLIVAGGLWLALWLSRIRWLGLGMIAAGLATIMFFTPYDLIVSANAKRIAYRSAAGDWVMLRGEVDSFESELWLRMQGQEKMLSRKEALGKIPELSCDKESCMIERNGHTLVVALSKKAGDLCESGADVIVTGQFLSCDHPAQVVDRGFVEENGGAALRFRGSMVELETSQQRRGHWPWVMAAKIIP